MSSNDAQSSGSVPSSLLFTSLYAFICFGVSIVIAFWMLETAASHNNNHSNNNNSRNNSNSNSNNNNSNSNNSNSRTVNKLHDDSEGCVGPIGEDPIYNPKNLWYIFSGICHCFLDYNMAFSRSASTIKPLLDFYSRGDARFDLKYMEINALSGFNASTRCPFILSATVLGPLCLYTAYLSSQKKKELFPWQSVCASIEIYNTVGFFIHFFMTKGLDQLHSHTLPVLFVLCINTLWFYINSHLLEESFLKLIK